MNTSILPRSNNTYDLGSSDYRWKDGYFSGFLDSNALKIDRLKILDTSYILRNVRWLHFDGENDYVVVQNSSSLNPSSVTVIALVKVLDYTRTYSYIFSKEGAYQLEIRPANRYIHFNRWIGGTKIYNYTYGGTLPSEGIIFLAATYDENWEKPKIYCNEQSLEVRGGEQSGALDSSTYDVYIAQRYTGAYKLCGDTYFFAEYNRPLDDDEIAQIRNYIMNGGGEMITDGLVLWYDGDSIDTANGIWRDKSGNGNDGIIYGATYQSIFDELTASDIPWGSVNSSILPISDNVYDLGSSSNRWKDGYFSGTVYASTFSGNIDWSNITGKPTPYSYDISSSSYTVDAGAETTLLSKSGEGFVNILYQGDGSADLSIRVYVDGSLDDEFSCDEIRVGTYTFNSSIEVKLYNPGTSSVTGNCPTSNVRGWVR